MNETIDIDALYELGSFGMNQKKRIIYTDKVPALLRLQVQREALEHLIDVRCATYYTAE